MPAMGIMMAIMTKAESGKSAFRIQDEAALARIIDRLVAELGNDTESVAADAIGLGQSTLNRLRRRVRHTISFETASLLEAAARRVGGDALARELSEAIVSRAAVDMLNDGYRVWCQERYDRFELLGSPATWGVDAQGRPQRVHGDVGEVIRQQSLLKIRKLAEAACAKELGAFKDWMRAQHVDEMRGNVALRSLVEPLLESLLSGYIERRWGELSTQEQRDFIKAGIAREKILLSRPHALERARQVVSRGVRRGPDDS